MIKKFRLYNFKAFQDTGDIELKPLTVLAGPNSGGKSSLLQSLLLLRQTFETEIPDISLNLSGRFLQFSGLNELTFSMPPSNKCKVIYKIRMEIGIPTETIPQYFPNLEIPKGAESLPLQSELEFSFRYGKIDEGKSQVILDHVEMNSWVLEIPGPRLLINLQDKGYQVKLEGKGVELPEPYQGKKS